MHDCKIMHPSTTILNSLINNQDNKNLLPSYFMKQMSRGAKAKISISYVIMKLVIVKLVLMLNILAVKDKLYRNNDNMEQFPNQLFRVDIMSNYKHDQ